jgi:hypothetical protein
MVVVISPEISVKVTPSVDDCHWNVDAPLVAHVPPVAVNVAEINVAPAMTGAVELTGATRPGVAPLPAIVEALVRSAM